MTVIENEQIRALDERVSVISDDIKEIKIALLGDAYNKHGVIPRLEQFEDDVKLLQASIDKLEREKKETDYKKNLLFGIGAALLTIALNISHIIELFKK